MSNQTIIRPEILDGTIFRKIPFGYTQLQDHHLDKLGGMNEKVLYVDRGKIVLPPGNGSHFDKSLPPYFMLTADFNRFFNICENESVPMGNQDKQVMVMFDEPISNLHSVGKVLGVRLEPNFWNLAENTPAIFVLIEKVNGKIEFCYTPIHKNSHYGEKLLPHIEKKFPRPLREINMTVDELISFSRGIMERIDLIHPEFVISSAVYDTLESMGLKAKD